MFFFKIKKDEPVEQEVDPVDAVEALRCLNRERNCVDIVIDFAIAKSAGFHVCAIERMSVGTKDERTIVGYIIAPHESTPAMFKEWKFYCSREQHQRLINEFQIFSKEQKR